MVARIHNSGGDPGNHRSPLDLTMNEILITIRGAQRVVHATRSSRLLDELIPALSDDPEEPWELECARCRFQPSTEPRDPLGAWRAGESESRDGGFCLVDLPARLIVVDVAEPESLRWGHVRPAAPEVNSAHWLPYRLSRDWAFVHPDSDWRRLACLRRAVRQPQSDTRAKLNAGVVSFLIDECRAARGGKSGDDFSWTPPDGWKWRELPARGAAERPTTVADAVAEIHARWLMTARQELAGRTPREVLLARREAIDMSVEDREHQWRLSGTCPPPLCEGSTAFRCAGYGTHEVIVYYHLVRYLTQCCWDLVTESPASKSVETRRAQCELDAARIDWLNCPYHDDFGRLTPAQIVRQERKRLPIALSRREALGDCRCPRCQPTTPDSLVFRYLDTYGMDDDAPFSLDCDPPRKNRAPHEPPRRLPTTGRWRSVASLLPAGGPKKRTQPA